jgi:hypothetical protein
MVKGAPEKAMPLLPRLSPALKAALVHPMMTCKTEPCAEGSSGPSNDDV